MNDSSGGSKLGPRERDVALWVLRHARVAGVDQLVRQLDRAVVVNDQPPTFLDIEVPFDAPRSTAPDGPLPVDVSVIGDSGELEGEILLWVSSGYLSALEHAWYTDDPPTEWPSPASLIEHDRR